MVPLRSGSHTRTVLAMPNCAVWRLYTFSKSTEPPTVTLCDAGAFHVYPATGASCSVTVQVVPSGRSMLSAEVLVMVNVWSTGAKAPS